MSPEHRAILERMRSSAGVVQRAVEAAPPGRFGQPPREGEWSALETLTHLRDVVVHVYGLRIRRLLVAQEHRIGPWVARDAGVAEALLVAALSLPFSESPSVIAPGANGAAREVLARYGFAQTGGTRHMRRGPGVRRERASIWGQVNYAAG